MEVLLKVLGSWKVLTPDLKMSVKRRNTEVAADRCLPQVGGAAPAESGEAGGATRRPLAGLKVPGVGSSGDVHHRTAPRRSMLSQCVRTGTETREPAVGNREAVD